MARAFELALKISGFVLNWYWHFSADNHGQQPGAGDGGRPREGVRHSRCSSQQPRFCFLQNGQGCWPCRIRPTLNISVRVKSKIYNKCDKCARIFSKTLVFRQRLTRISPAVFPNLTKTLGWVGRFTDLGKLPPQKKRFYFLGLPYSEVYQR